MQPSLRAVSATAVAVLLVLLPLAGTATAAVPQTSASSSSGRYETTIRFLNFHHVRAAGSSVTISGQVAATVNGTTGAVSNAAVKLYRRVSGASRWQYVAAATTTQTGTPEFRFTVTTNATADYQVRFAGTSSYQPATGMTSVGVHRLIRGRIQDRSGRLSGRVAGYAHRWVHLQKRTCARCGWKVVRTARAGDHGHYRFTLGAPRSGRWYWRLTTSGTKRFVRSSSGVFATRLV